MINKKTYIVIVISILSLGLTSFVIPQNTHAQNNSCVVIKNTLRVGSKDSQTNSEVSKLQNFLKTKGYMFIDPTGYFGYTTEKAVRKFQTAEKINAIGTVGPLTRSRINSITCVPSISEQTPATSPSTTTIAVPVKSLTVKLPYNSINFNEWKNLWGNVATTTDNTLQLNATETTTGAQTVLENSNNWSNYKVNTNVFVKQATVTLISRYVDENNFLACTFSGRYIEIIQKVNGVSSVVAYTTVEDAPYTRYFYNDLNLTMSVDGKKVTCGLIGDENLKYEKIDEKLLNGGIGLQIWANSNGVAKIELKSVKVVSI